MTPCCLLNVSRRERKVIFMRSLLLQAVEQHMGYLCLQRSRWTRSQGSWSVLSLTHTSQSSHVELFMFPQTELKL